MKFGALHHGGQLRDRDRRGAGGDHRIPGQRVDLAQDLQLQLKVLGGRLDHQLAALQVFVADAALHAGEDLVALGGVCFSF
jgi:hypothetical protein